MTVGGQQGQCEGMRGKSGTGARCSGFQDREMPEKEEDSYVQFMAESLLGFLLRESKPVSYLSGLRVGRVKKKKKKILSARTTFAARKTMRFCKQK